MTDKIPGNKTGNLVAIIFLAGIMLAFYFPAVFDGKVIAPHNMSGWYPWKGMNEQLAKDDYGYRTLDDVLRSFYPYHHFIKEDFNLKRIWAWDPYRGCGIPFPYLSPVLYLFSMLFMHDEMSGMTAAAILMMFLSGLATFYFLREMGIGLVPSVTGAAAFMLNSFSLVYSGFIHELTAVTFLPVLLLCTEKAVKKADYIYIAPLALVIAAVFYCGKPQLTVHLLYLSFFYVVCRVFFIGDAIRKGGVKRILIIFTASLAAAAIMYLPQAAAVYELAKHSDRLSKTFGFFATSKYPILSFVTAGAYDFFGAPLTPNFWGPGFMFSLVECYVGVITVLLLFASAVDRKKRQFYFWSVVLLTAVLVAVDNGLYRLFVDYLPGFRMSKNRPGEVILFSFFILASIGFDNIINNRNSRVLRRIFTFAFIITSLLLAAAVAGYAYKPLFAVVQARFPDITASQLSGAFRAAAYSLLMAASCSAVTMFYLEGRLGRRVFQGAVLILVLTDIFVVNKQLRYIQEPSDLYRMTDGLKFIKEDKDIFRVMRIGSWDMAPTQTLEVFDIQDAQIYDSLLNSNYVSYMRNIEEGIVVLDNRIVSPLSQVSSTELPAFSLLNVKYLLSVDALRNPGLKLVYDKEIRIYQNINFLPRAFMVHEFRQAKNNKEILSSLKDRSFRPDKTVFLEGPAGIPVTLSVGKINDVVKITRYSSEAVDIKVDAVENGLLVLTDLYWPDWKAYVDGKETKIFKADYMFRALPVNKGTHEVRFEFRPDWLKKYYYIAGLSFIATILIMAGYTIKRFLKRIDSSKANACDTE